MRHIIPILICSNNDFSNLSVRLVWVYTANEFQEIPWVELPVMRQQERVRLPWPEARCPTGMGTLGTKYGLVWWLPRCQMPYWDRNKTHTGFRKLSLQRQLYILIIPRLNVHQPPDKEWSLTSCISIRFVFVFPVCFFCLLTLKPNIFVV